MAREVLIVDDDDAFSDLAARVVAAWGHVVVGQAGSVLPSLRAPRRCARRLCWST